MHSAPLLLLSGGQRATAASNTCSGLAPKGKRGLPSLDVAASGLRRPPCVFLNVDIFRASGGETVPKHHECSGPSRRGRAIGGSVSPGHAIGIESRPTQCLEAPFRRDCFLPCSGRRPHKTWRWNHASPHASTMITSQLRGRRPRRRRRRAFGWARLGTKSKVGGFGQICWDEFGQMWGGVTSIEAWLDSPNVVLSSPAWVNFDQSRGDIGQIWCELDRILAGIGKLRRMDRTPG